MPVCPVCGKELIRVRYPANSPLNREQWASQRAGDWYCETCPSGWATNRPYRYFWDHEVKYKKPVEESWDEYHTYYMQKTAQNVKKVGREPTRVSWDQYFMQVAQMVATRATCPRKSVGCVLVRDRMIISTGYNGSIRGMPHCTDVGCVMENDHCASVIHAELNAIVQAARNGVRIEGAECYVTASPCWNCFKILANAGVKRIVYGEFYRDERVFGVAEDLGIEMVLVQGVS